MLFRDSSQGRRMGNPWVYRKKDDGDGVNLGFECLLCYSAKRKVPSTVDQDHLRSKQHLSRIDNEEAYESCLANIAG